MPDERTFLGTMGGRIAASSNSLSVMPPRTWQALLLVAIVASPASTTFSAETWHLELQEQVKRGAAFQVVTEAVEWKPAETAIVVVDMWNDHHCKSAAKRVVEMAPQMNKLLEAAREKGIFIIHSPSGCMDTYENTPARERAKAAPLAKAAVNFQWNHFNPDREGPLDEKLLRQSLSMSDPLQGAIGAQSSQLVMLGNHLHAALDEALADANDPLDKFNKLLPAIEAYLKINRQFDRFARLNHDLMQRLSAAQKTQPGSGKDQSEELGN